MGVRNLGGSLFYSRILWRVLDKFLSHVGPAPYAKISIRTEDLGRNILSHLGHIPMRTAEYSFITKNLDLSSGNILDIGCSGSLLPYKLARAGYSVSAMDLGFYPERHANMSFIKADAQKIPFQTVFDRITCVSTIEHIGYGTSSYNFGDIVTMEEFFHVCKTNGKVLLTTPFLGRYRQDLPLISSEINGKVYDENRLNLLTKKFVVEKEEYLIFDKKAGWIRQGKKKANDAYPFSIVCLVLRKREID